MKLTPGAAGYVPSPLTVTDTGFVPVPVASTGVVAQFVSFTSLNVMLPPAAAPAEAGFTDGIIEPLPVAGPVPGWLAVPDRVALSYTAAPKFTVVSGLANVVSVGATGFTIKHSFARASVEP